MNIGAKIKELRVKKSLTQEELADRCELSKGFISQLERDLTSPSIATLVDILQCLGTNLEEFFSNTAKEQVVFSKTDYFKKVDSELKNKIEWIIPNAQKNMMEPVLVELAAGASTSTDFPHDGEEFGYVLEGKITVIRAGKSHTAKKGESFYYSADKEHQIVNKGKSKAKFIWISTPPNF